MPPRNTADSCSASQTSTIPIRYLYIGHPLGNEDFFLNVESEQSNRSLNISRFIFRKSDPFRSWIIFINILINDSIRIFIRKKFKTRSSIFILDIYNERLKLDTIRIYHLSIRENSTTRSPSSFHPSRIISIRLKRTARIVKIGGVGGLSITGRSGPHSRLETAATFEDCIWSGHVMQRDNLYEELSVRAGGSYAE